MLSTLREVLLGVDLSEERDALDGASEAATELVRELAGGRDLHVTIAHVPLGTRREQALAVLEARCEWLESNGARVDLATLDGEPGAALAALAEQRAVDLVVLGKSDPERHPPRFVGSTARAVLHRCTRPVWLVRAGAMPIPRRVLVAVDLDAVCEAALRAAAEIAASVDAELHVAHAYSVPPSVQLEGTRAEFGAKRRAEAAQWIRERLPAEGLRRPQLHIAADSPEHLILRAAQWLVPDLVVLGHHGRSGLQGVVVGNTAERLLRRLDPSLLVVRPLHDAEHPGPD